MTRNRRLILMSVFLAFFLVMASAMAESAQSVRIRMSNGKIWRGELNSHVEVSYKLRAGTLTFAGQLIEVHDMYVKLRGSSGDEKTIFHKDLVGIKTSSETTNDRENSALPEVTPETQTELVTSAVSPNDPRPHPGLPHIFVLPLKGGVGAEIRHEEIDLIGAEADKYGPGQIIVLEIDSPGGSVAQMEMIHDSLARIRSRHRLVAWLDDAISAGCATAVCCPEIYFKTAGVAGSMTAFNMVTGARTGERLEQWLQVAGSWMEEGGRSPYIAHAMIHAPRMLSYDKDPISNEVTWRNDLSGEFIVSRPGENITFNATQAVHSGFAQGIADTQEELAALLDLPRWYETNDYGRKIAKDWKNTLDRAKEEIPLILQRLNFEGSGSRDRTIVISKQIQNFKKLRKWCIKAEWFVRSTYGLEREPIEAQIEQLERQLRRLRNR